MSHMPTEREAVVANSPKERMVSEADGRSNLVADGDAEAFRDRSQRVFEKEQLLAGPAHQDKNSAPQRVSANPP